MVYGREAVPALSLNEYSYYIVTKMVNYKKNLILLCYYTAFMFVM